MFLPLEQELFPDECEAVEMPLHNQWVFLIQKNGTSGLRVLAKKQQLRILKNQDLQELSHIDVYVRDPKTRYISGVNTFLQHTLRDHPSLDPDTCLWFVQRYRFLNRHFLPQWHWLANLSRFLDDSCQIRFRDFADFGNIIDTKDDAQVIPASDQLREKIAQFDPNLEFWFFVDQILLELAGQSMTWQDMLGYFDRQHPEVLRILLDKNRKIKHVLPQA